MPVDEVFEENFYTHPTPKFFGWFARISRWQTHFWPKFQIWIHKNGSKYAKCGVKIYIIDLSRHYFSFETYIARVTKKIGDFGWNLQEFEKILELLKIWVNNFFYTWISKDASLLRDCESTNWKMFWGLFCLYKAITLRKY